MRKILCVLVVSLQAATARAAESAPAAPPMPPEVKKTVDAFNGKWVFDGVVSMEGKQVKGKITIDCKKIALGNAVMCTMKGTLPGFPPEDNGVMVGYDMGGKVVHFMAMTTGGEMHDHKCQWKDEKTLSCDPLAYIAMDGSAATEDLSFSWSDPKTSSFKALITVGSMKVTFEGAGKRK